MTIKKGKNKVNKLISVNRINDKSIILGIMVSLILFIVIGNMYTYFRQIKILEVKSKTGNYEAILTEASKEDVDTLRSNVLIENIGVYKNIYREKIKLDDEDKSINIFALDNIVLNEIFSPIIIISKGRVPQNNKEIIIDTLGKEILNKDIGDFVNLNNINYEIVGIYTETKASNFNDVQLITLFEDLHMENMNVAFSVKNKVRKDLAIKKIVENLGVISDDLNTNKELFFNNLLFFNYGINAIDSKVIILYNWENKILLYLIIIILTSFLIYGSINVLVRSRIQEFSILRCIGATPSKIRKIVIKESGILLLWSLIPSIIIGQVLSYLISEIVLNKIMNINNYGLSYGIYFSVLIISVFLSSISIGLAILGPIIKIGKVHPIDEIKFYKENQSGIRKGKCKLIKKIFKYNGEFAYKNVKANRKSFLLRTIVSVLGLTVFIVFVGYHKNVFEVYVKQKELVNDATIDISFINKDDRGNIFYYVDKYVNEIEELGIAKDVFAIVNYNLDGIVKNAKLNDWFIEKNEDDINCEKTININGEKAIFSNNISLIIMNDIALKKVVLRSKNQFKEEDFNNNGVVVTDRIILRNYINPSRENIFNLKKGDTFSLLIKTKAAINNEYDISKEINELIEINNQVKFKYIGSIDGNIIFNGGRHGFSDYLTFIVSEDFYKNNYESFKLNDKYLEVKRVSLFIDFNNNIDRSAQMQIVKDYSNKVGGDFLDNKQRNKSIEESSKIISFITYIVMGLTAIICAINAININNINIKNRYREIGTILAIGISKKRLTHILLLESVIEWFIASVITLISSYIILEILYKVLFYSFKIEVGSMPVGAALIGVGYLFVINIIARYLAVKKLACKNTIDLHRYDKE
ncbi:FtsX-like permease family protein [Clostridium sp.]|uniref:FtsX-like permease family protein n=1 Tax=Clostridium sp. TaxID=1506 RepID=UPI003F2D525D